MEYLPLISKTFFKTILDLWQLVLFIIVIFIVGIYIEVKKTKIKSSIDRVFNNDVELETCPECGGNLLKKSGKYGKFFGCSNYPKCKFTKKIQ